MSAKSAKSTEEDLRLKELAAKTLADDEVRELKAIENLAGGYFLAGRKKSDRSTSAFRIGFQWDRDKTPITRLQLGTPDIQGVNMFILRMLNGIDPSLLERIAADPRWQGGRAALNSIVAEYGTYHGYSLPIRDAVEMVYSFIYCTIKALRFSRLTPICGGPIEIASVTTDRGFRWVSHKELDVAVHQALFNETRHV